MPSPLDKAGLPPSWRRIACTLLRVAKLAAETLLTVAHRSGLAQHHTHELRLDGRSRRSRKFHRRLVVAPALLAAPLLRGLLARLLLGVA